MKRTLIKTVNGKTIGVEFENGEQVAIDGYEQPATIVSFGRFFVTVTIGGKKFSINPAQVNKWTKATS